MYVEVLQRYFKQKDLVSAKQVHDCIRKSAMEQNIYVANNLLRGYAQYDHAEYAMEALNQLCQEGAQPDEITYLSILKACASSVGLEWGKEVHTHIRNGAFDSDVRVGTALLKMYAKSGRIDDAGDLFDRMVDQDVITWNVIIGWWTCTAWMWGMKHINSFSRCREEAFVRDAATYVRILNPSASAGALEWVKDIHSHALGAALESDLHVGTALVNMYSKSVSIDDARLVFDSMEDCDVVTWTVMIGGLAQHGFGYEAFSLFLGLRRGGLVPNAITYLIILSACASAGCLKRTKEVHSHTLRAGLESDVRVGSALVHMYAKGGSIVDDADCFLTVSWWNAMYLHGP